MCPSPDISITRAQHVGRFTMHLSSNITGCIMHQQLRTPSQNMIGFNGFTSSPRYPFLLFILLLGHLLLYHLFLLPPPLRPLPYSLLPRLFLFVLLSFFLFLPCFLFIFHDLLFFKQATPWGGKDPPIPDRTRWYWVSASRFGRFKPRQRALYTYWVGPKVEIDMVKR